MLDNEFSVSLAAGLIGVIAGFAGLIGAYRSLRGSEEREIEKLYVAMDDGQPDRDEPSSVPVAKRRAERRIDKLVARYRRNLTMEADRVARAHSADEPSVAHVMMAANAVQLAPPLARTLADIGLALGAFALGIPMTYVVNVQTGGTTSPTAVPWLIGFGAFALVLLTASVVTKVWK